MWEQHLEEAQTLLLKVLEEISLKCNIYNNY